MDQEALPSGGRPRRRAAVVGAGTGLVAALVVGVGVRSGAHAPRPAALGPVPVVAPAPAPAATAPPATVPPPSVVATAPVPTAPPAPAVPPTTTAPAARAPVPPPAPLPLPVALDQALAGTPGCLVVEQDGAILFERQPTAAFVPASSQKLMVAAAVLARLGPDFRFDTQVVAPRAPDGGRLDDAWLVGAGDPFLATPGYIVYAAGKPRLVSLPLTPLADLADRLAAAGVRDIPGGLRPDESRYDRQRFVPSWKPSYVREAEVGSLGALTVDEGLASWGPSQAVAPDPAASAASALTNLLGERGVTAAAPPAPDGRSAPAGHVVVASVRSAPLGEIVAAMLRVSDNYAAEMLLRELDRQTGGPGTTAGGATRVVEEMAAAGVRTDGVHLNDGSGLDVGNRSTCTALLGALSLSARPGLGALAEGLAVAGRSGTLVTRFVGTPVEGRLAAKTGWLKGAAALVGRLDRDGGAGGPSPAGTRRFALLLNADFDYATAKAIQDRVVTVLATAP